MHHLVEGGWVWVLRFNNGIVSAGVAADVARFSGLELRRGEIAWHALLDRYPSLEEQFADAQPIREFTHLKRGAFRSPQAARSCWALLPGTAGFVDPLLSTGFALNLFGIARLATILEDNRITQGISPSSLQRYEEQTLTELDLTAELVGALYHTIGDFELFSALALLYFAAVSYSETVRRLGEPSRASGFLLAGDPIFTKNLKRCCAAARQILRPAERAALLTKIKDSIKPIDVAGLGNPDRRNWFPVDFEDLRRATPRLGLNPDRVERFIGEAEAACNKAHKPSMSGQRATASASRVRG